MVSLEAVSVDVVVISSTILLGKQTAEVLRRHWLCADYLRCILSELGEWVCLVLTEFPCSDVSDDFQHFTCVIERHIVKI